MRSLVGPLIERVLFRGLVFNQSWEDPDLDRAALDVAPDRDTVLTITSGGCNSLNLLCLKPRRLICVDGNPAQTQLLALKLAAIRHLDHAGFFTMFGAADGPAAARVYTVALRPHLTAATRDYWDANRRLLERGLFTQGRLGLFLRWIRTYLRVQLGERRIAALFAAPDLDAQRDHYYAEIHPRLWRGSVLRMLGSRPVLAVAGMHPGQYELIADHGGIEDYIRDRVEYVLTSVPIRGNYFAAQAAFGSYLDARHVPPYLLAENYPILQANVDRVTNLTGWLVDRLRGMPDASVDKFSLLDILDWMEPTVRLATLGEVLRVAAPGGRFVYRSTVASLPVPPELAERVVAEDDLARRLFAGDRSATYSSFYVYRLAA